MFWMRPLIHKATTFFGLSGFTATHGSPASWIVQFPGGVKPSLQPARGLGNEISIAGPRVTWARTGTSEPRKTSAIPARPAPNLFSACRRVTDWAKPLATSSNLRFMIFLFLFLFDRGAATPLSPRELTRPHGFYCFV